MRTLTDVSFVREFLASLTVGEPLHYEALTVVPLFSADAPDPGWLTLDQAERSAHITEVSEGGSVPDLVVMNEGDAPLLLLDGEELIGAKQNRVLNTTVLVGASAGVQIPVSCVEQGRWHYRSRGFVSGHTALYASVRRLKASKVSESLRSGSGHQADQHEVWEELAAKASTFGVKSSTGAMHDVYERYGEELA